jgi:nucleoside-diphosphate-sugar epimerase
MSKILITGATGFIGKALCRHLRQAGHTLSGTSRNRSLRAGPENIPLYYVQADQADADWAHPATGADAVVHLAARVHVMKDDSADPLSAFRQANRDATLALAKAAAEAGVKRFLFLSSVKVNGEATIDTPFSEADAPTPADAYGVSKWEAEQGLSELAQTSNMEIVTLRVPLVYGPAVKGNFLSLLRACARARPLPLGGINNHRSLLYVGNLVSAIEAVLNHAGPVSGTYLMSDGDDLSTPALALGISDALGVPSKVFGFPVGLLRLAATCLGKSAAVDRLTGSLQVDSGKFRDTFTWNPPYTVADGLQSTANWYQNAD